MRIGAHWLRPLLLYAVPASVAGVLAIVWLVGRPGVSTENAYVKADVVHIAPEVGGRLIAVDVKDHMTVRQGDVLVRIDQQPYELALAKAEAELDQARIQVETLRAVWLEAQTELKEAVGKVQFTEQQLERQKQLAGRGIAATVKFEEAESAAVAARDRVTVLQQKVIRTLAALGGDADTKTEQHGLVREKRAARDRAALDLAQTVIRSPVNGTAVNVKLMVGEQAKAATPLFAIVSDREPWIEANFKETDLTHVRPGHQAEVTFDIYPDQTFKAVVESISPATGAEFAVLPPQNASGNWVKVVQRLPVRLRILPRADIPVMRAGMTATVSVDTGRERRIAGLTSWWRAEPAQAGRRQK